MVAERLVELVEVVGSKGLELLLVGRILGRLGFALRKISCHSHGLMRCLMAYLERDQWKILQ
jgi:hypothetical protein